MKVVNIIDKENINDKVDVANIDG